MTDDRELTFIVWGDTHFGYEQTFGPGDIRYRAVGQMARLEGYPYPDSVGGCVGRIELILHCGDIADGGDFQLGQYLHCMRQIDCPSYETLGNHDKPFEPWFIEKYRQRWYAFDRGGAHFVSLYQPFGALDDVTAMCDEQLSWLAVDLAAVEADTPTIVFTHSKPQHLSNVDALDEVLRAANVILLFCGHTHLQSHRVPHRFDWNGRDCITVGHCRNHPIDPIYARTFYVVGLRGSDYHVATWRWNTATWA